MTNPLAPAPGSARATVADPSLLGLGTALPARMLDRDEALDLAVRRCATGARQAAILERLYRRTAIDTRGVCLAPDERHLSPFYPAEIAAAPTTARRMERFELLAPPLAERACARALSDAVVPAATITHLIVVTCTGFAAPGLEIALVRRLGLPANVARVQLGFMGCHGAIAALRLARSIASADPATRVLVCAVELCSLHFQYGWRADQLVCNALFADGAAAAVVGRATPGDATWRLRSSRSHVIDDTIHAMGWHIGDHGFVMTLSSEVPGILGGVVGPWVDAWLSEHGTDRAEIGAWAIHAGGPRIVRSVAGSLGLNDGHLAASFDVLRRAGNMSSATILFILEALRRQGTRPTVALAFGPGLTAEALLLTAG